MRLTGWWEVVPPMLSAIHARSGQEGDAAAIIRQALRAGGMEDAASARAAASCADPLALLMTVASLPSDDARAGALSSLQAAAGLFVSDGLDLLGMLPPASVAPQVAAEATVLMNCLAEKAAEAADARAFGMLPNVQRRAFVDALKDALAALGPGALPWLSHALYLLRPQAYLPLDGVMRAFLTAPEGLGIDAADLPGTAMEYLDLLMFLTRQMDEAALPYRDFLQMGRAAQEGRALAEGLCHADRAALVASLRPSLQRLFPRDEARVDAELARLAAGDGLRAG